MCAKFVFTEFKSGYFLGSAYCAKWAEDNHVG